MPTYEYRCKDCGEHLEVVQSFKDDALTECPACGGGLRKVFGNIGITFKGSGFYRTDSRSGSGRGSDAAAASTSSTETKAGSDKSDTKSSSDTKTTTKPDAAPSSSSAASAATA